MKITKYKNNNSADTFNNRLIRLERILETLLSLAGEDGASLMSSKPVQINSGLNSNILNKMQVFAKNGIQNTNSSSAAFTIRQQGVASTSMAKNNINNLLLSQGQIISQIASAIANAAQRNS